MKKKTQKEKIKFEQLQDVAKQYIIDTFSLYCSNEDIQNLLEAVIDFSNGKEDFSKYKSINPKELKPIDLKHFGWNIWNHFGKKNRNIIPFFLKNIFREKLSDSSIGTLEAKLTTERNKGKIKIKENLSIME